MTLATQNNEYPKEKGKNRVVVHNGSKYRNSGEQGESLNYYL